MSDVYNPETTVCEEISRLAVLNRRLRLSAERCDAAGHGTRIIERQLEENRRRMEVLKRRLN